MTLKQKPRAFSYFAWLLIPCKKKPIPIRGAAQAPERANAQTVRIFSVRLSIAYTLVINCSLNNETRENINSEYFLALIQAENILFLFCSDFHIDLTKHTAPWLPAAEQTRPSGDGKPDCVQIRTRSIPPRTICIFFPPASRKLKGMQINKGLCEGIVMSRNNEVP